MRKNLNSILKQFIDPEYIEPESSKYLLIEKQESGYTELNVEIRGENICIAQYDKKKADVDFGIDLRKQG